MRNSFYTFICPIAFSLGKIPIIYKFNFFTQFLSLR